MLDDKNVYKQRDPSGLLGVISEQWQQLSMPVDVVDGDHDGRQITKVVIAAMGSGALAAQLAKSGLYPVVGVPVEIVSDYDLPEYVDNFTLIVAVSYSGNSSEVLSCVQKAQEKGAQLAVVGAGGKLVENAKLHGVARIIAPAGLVSRVTVLFSMRAITVLLAHFGVAHAGMARQVEAQADFIREETQNWLPSVSTGVNYAKQLALLTVGKTAVIYGARLGSPVAHKWKIALNENAKNLAFCSEYPDAMHNEFAGWSSHPVDKPFAVIDIVSSYDRPEVLRQFEAADKLLSGLRPKAITVNLKGDLPLAQVMWGVVLGDVVSAYLAILNGVDPGKLAIVDKLKAELGE